MTITMAQKNSLVNLLAIAEKSLQLGKTSVESVHEQAVADHYYLRAVKALNEADSVLKRRSAFA